MELKCAVAVKKNSDAMPMRTASFHGTKMRAINVTATRTIIGAMFGRRFSHLYTLRMRFRLLCALLLLAVPVFANYRELTDIPVDPGLESRIRMAAEKSLQQLPKL